MNQLKNNTCLVIGNGAIGTAIASRLMILGYCPVFVGRKGSAKIKSRFEGWGGVNYLQIKPLSDADLSKVAIVFITVKAFDLAGVINRYLPYISTEVPVIPLCNGAVDGIVMTAAQKFPHFNWRLGVCDFGVTQISDEIYSLKSTSGRAAWGPLQLSSVKVGEQTEIEKQILSDDGNSFFVWDIDILSRSRHKWLFNVTINSLSAVHNLEKNGALLNDLNILKKVFKEAFCLGLELWGSWSKTESELYGELIRLITATSENENSMARDLRMGKKTENCFLANLASDKRGYNELKKLSEEIERRTPNRTQRRITD